MAVNIIDFTKESSLLEPIARYIRRKGFRFQMQELPFYQRSVDIYGFSKITNKTIAIELKLHKWKKAIEQAILYQLCADEAYIAMPKKFIGRVNVDLLIKYGVGLISVSQTGRCQKVVEAKQSSVLRIGYKNNHIDYLQRQIDG
ncbi:MAG: hypothetical protein KAR47_01485 [Planctomycetes bacterium]|nr:hypothetical protein [Planctomycetota bacterium]